MSVGEVDPETKWGGQGLEVGDDIGANSEDPYRIPDYADHPAEELSNIVLGEE